ncbi:MAG: hypothetical protein ACR2JX_10785 [Mycobacteriales bacterium]
MSWKDGVVPGEASIELCYALMKQSRPSMWIGWITAQISTEPEPDFQW